ncbi:MAG: sulfatase-like hydrolase/transferase [Gemmobacter sp.]
MMRGNVLLVTIDQLSAEVLDGPLGAFVPTPNLDRLAAGGARFDFHHTVTVPCGPARASLLTGLYAMNHRAIRNGTPLARHHATVATEARKAGYEPLLMGYSDIAPDPEGRDPEDPDLHIYEGVAPGFRELVEMRMETGREWPAHLRARGHAVDPGDPAPVPAIYRPVAPPGRPPRPSDPAIYAACDSDTAYLTDRSLAALDIRRGAPWFAHLAYIRPHPPLVAPAPWNRLVDPARLPAPEMGRPDHPLVRAWFSAPSNAGLFWGFDGDCAALAPETVAELRAVYLGLVAEVDHHLGRVLDWLDATGQAGRTLVIVTADHGEMLGAKGMWGKIVPFGPALRVPLFVRAPGMAAGLRIAAPTESVDLAPTILDWIGRAPPPAMDGVSLLPLLSGGGVPAGWREGTLTEIDFGHPTRPTPIQTALGLEPDAAGAAIWRDTRWSYVHFAGPVAPMLFDRAADPQEARDLGSDPAHAPVREALLGRILGRMMQRRDRRLTHLSFGA